jgi:AraC family transcriptional regulator
VNPDRLELLPLLVYVQAHLDEDLGLTALARRAGLSPAHFQRVFTAAIGESPRAYVARLRLEQAAFYLHIHDDTLLSVALACGFHNHETFTRAFRRRFRVTPRVYRARARRDAATRGGDAATEAPTPTSLSPTRVRRLRAVDLACLRHLGPYQDVPEALFDRLEAWATRRGLGGPRLWMGLGHDAPATTAADQLRFDAALVVPGPFQAEGDIVHARFPGGDHAVTTHVGPYAALPATYAAIVPRLAALPHHELAGLPAVELYQTSRVCLGLELNVTEVCLRVRPRPRPVRR